VEILVFLVVLWCVYLSDSVWWIRQDTVVLSGSRVGQFTAQAGPSLEIRDGTGFALTSLFPPFTYSFECAFYRGNESTRSSPTDAQLERLATQALVLAAPLRRLGEGLWIYLFVVAPIVIATFGLARTWLVLVVILLLWLVAIVVMFRRAWRQLYAGTASAWKSDAILMVLSPLGAIRAADKLTRTALAASNPLQAASLVASPEEFCRLARLMYFDQTALLPPALKEDVDRILQKRRIRALFDAAPAREPGMTGFCPRCHTQVMRSSGNCPDCVELAVTPF
jgi:hypothetical protein